MCYCLQLLNKPCRLVGSCRKELANGEGAQGHETQDRRQETGAKGESHLRFFAVSRMEPRWWSSIRLRIWGVTSVPSHPIISIWPIALRSTTPVSTYRVSEPDGAHTGPAVESFGGTYQSRSFHSGSKSCSILAMFDQGR
jgi:hypothetical protein